MSFKDEHSSQINILFDILKNHVNDKFWIDVDTIDDIKVKSRKKHLIYFRKMMMVILGETYISDKVTQRHIAEVVDRDRTSFIHHFNNHLNDYIRYPDYKKDYDQLRVEFDEKKGDEF